MVLIISIRDTIDVFHPVPFLWDKNILRKKTKAISPGAPSDITETLAWRCAKPLCR